MAEEVFLGYYQMPKKRLALKLILKLSISELQNTWQNSMACPIKVYELALVCGWLWFDFFQNLHMEKYWKLERLQLPMTLFYNPILSF